MRKVNQYSVLPEQDEIIRWEEVFGSHFGEGRSGKMLFGVRNGKLNPTRFCLETREFDHTEHRLELSLGSLMTNIMPGIRAIVVSTKPLAELGDPDNIAEAEYGMGKANRILKFYVNDAPEHPGGVQFITKRVLEDGNLVLRRVPDPDQGIWLKPYVRHYITIYRVGEGVEFGQSRNTPMSLWYGGGGNPSDEIHLDMDDLTGEVVMYEATMPLLGPGMFIPDNG